MKKPAFLSYDNQHVHQHNLVTGRLVSTFVVCVIPGVSELDISLPTQISNWGFYTP